MNFTIISCHIGTHGSLLNLLDMQHYLINKGHDVTFYCYDINRIYTSLLKTKRQYKVGTIIELPDERDHIVCDGNVITDFKSLCMLEPSIVCKKLVIFDNAELSYHLNGTLIDFYPKDVGDIRTKLNKHTFVDHIFLMPPCNFSKFKIKYPDLKSEIFFKKINHDALSTLRLKNNGKIFYRMEDGGDGEHSNFKLKEDPSKRILRRFPHAVKLKDLTTQFEYGGMIYYRRKDRAYYEQLGRLVFEFLILGKKVLFMDDPMEIDDGLKDYWKHNMLDGNLRVEEYEYEPWI